MRTLARSTAISPSPFLAAIAAHHSGGPSTPSYRPDASTSAPSSINSRTRSSASAPPPASTALAAHHSGDVEKKLSPSSPPPPPCEPPALGSAPASRRSARAIVVAPGTRLRAARQHCHSSDPAAVTVETVETVLRSSTPAKGAIDATSTFSSVSDTPVNAASSADASAVASYEPSSSRFFSFAVRSVPSPAISHSNTVSSPPGAGSNKRLAHAVTTRGDPYHRPREPTSVPSPREVAWCVTPTSVTRSDPSNVAASSGATPSPRRTPAAPLAPVAVR
mmetsp:Transcript_3360/g.14708  ORF Transcript_3360/g.14708 Transcript_3360/m.14708 type:complete len:278 (+) Transcript_3360:503-1336(+)